MGEDDGNILSHPHPVVRRDRERANRRVVLIGGEKGPIAPYPGVLDARKEVAAGKGRKGSRARVPALAKVQHAHRRDERRRRAIGCSGAGKLVVCVSSGRPRAVLGDRRVQEFEPTINRASCGLSQHPNDPATTRDIPRRPVWFPVPGSSPTPVGGLEPVRGERLRPFARVGPGRGPLATVRVVRRALCSATWRRLFDIEEGSGA